MNILCIGACGFIGTNFVKMLTSNPSSHDKIVVVDKLSYAGCLDNIHDLINDYDFLFYCLDICDYAKIDDIVTKHGIDIIYNFAAESHVDRSINNCNEFIESNIKGVQVLLDIVKKHKIRLVQISTDEVYGSMDIGTYADEESSLKPNNPYCLHPDTEIFLNNGIIKKIKDISINDKIITYDFNIKKTRPSNISALYKFRVDKLIKIETDFGTIKCTRNHKFLIKRPKRINKNKLVYKQNFNILPELWVEANDIKVGDWMAYNKKINIDEIESGISNEWARFIGYFTGDGYIKKSFTKKFNRYNYYITLADINKKFIEFYNSFLPNNGTIYKHKTKNCWYSQTGCKNIIDKLKNEPYSLKTRYKYLPDSIMLSSDNVIANFLGGLFDADGSSYGHIISITTFSFKLLKQINFLLFRLGIQNKIDYKNRRIAVTDTNSYNIFIEKIPTLKKIKKYNTKSQRTFCENFIYRTVRSINEIEYNGDVYDVEVDNTHNYILQNNLLSHNSSTKASADLLCRAYNKTFGTDVVITRSVNNFGAYQYPEKLIPLAITNLLEGKKVPIYGSGEQVRCWIPVEDNCKFIISAGIRGKSGGIYNISSKHEMTNIEIIKTILDEMGLTESNIEFVKDRPGHDFRYAITSLYNEEIVPNNLIILHTKFDYAISQTIDWYIKNEKWWTPKKAPVV